MGKPFIDLTNQTFNYWTVTGPHKSVPRPDGRGNRTHWFCTCQCGNTAWVDATNLRQGISQSCGCKPKRIVAGKGSPAALAASKANTKHGMNRSNKLRTRLYNIWNAMKTRCYNPNCATFHHYGGRGITVCKEWHNFELFQAFAIATGYTDSLTIERNNVNGNYSPENCRWIPRGQQTRNTRRTNWITPTLSVSEFCEIHQVPYDLVWHALRLKNDFPQVWKTVSDL